MCMRKFQSFAFAGAIALAGVTGFSACSSDDAAEAPINPTFDGESVKTAFTISLPGATGTRMTDSETQATGTFQGMKEIYLFPFATATPASGVQATDVFSKSPINLANIGASDLKGTSNKKRYDNVAFELGVNSFLFYARTNYSTQDGDLVPSYTKKTMQSTDQVSSVDFSLVPAYVVKTTEEQKVLSALNGIVTAFNTNMSSHDYLKNLFDQFTAKQSDNSYKAWAGSSTSVYYVMLDLLTNLKTRKTALGTTSTGEDAAIDNIINAIPLTHNGTAYVWNDNPNFPKCANLPDGAVAVQYDNTTSAFKYVTPSVDGMNIADRSLYTKPAALYYFVNSAALTSNTTHQTQLTDETTLWSAITPLYTNGNEIQATTQSVIIEKPIQYGVADLKSRIYILDNVSLKDSKQQTVSAPAEGYKVTGILVGGQKNVDWKFETSGSTEYTVYDGNIANSLVAKVEASNSVTDKWNHTLVLETAEDTNDDKLYNIAVELENTGNAFYGQDGMLIEHGTKFYLVAQVKASQASNSSSVASGINNKKLFQQDVTTTITFKIGANTLGKAYNVIPDLRSPKLEFGLSVDLTWQSGLTFDVNL